MIRAQNTACLHFGSSNTRLSVKCSLLKLSTKSIAGVRAQKGMRRGIRML